MNNIDNIVIKHILEAQRCSDAAKATWNRAERGLRYAEKDEHLQKAVSTLRGAKNSRIQFKIVEAPDQNGYRSNIYYFEFKKQGKRYQFSFHNPKVLYHKPLGNKAIEWDGIVGGCKRSYKEIRKHS